MSYVGIDLGTTHSLVSVFEDGKANLVKNALGEYLTPSVVYIDKDQNVIVGKEAKERLVTHPDDCVANFKRMMGSSKTYTLQKKQYTPVELSALLLKELIRDAKVQLGDEITHVVISVPAYFNEPQRRATIAAANLAGIDVAKIINEPTAAAIDYSVNELDEAHLLVLDLGGGTFDVTVLELFDDIMEVHASAGNNHLGGEDFTAVVKRILMGKLNLDESNLKDGEIAYLMDCAENIKRKLSSENKVSYQIVLNDNAQEIEISADEFKTQSQDLLVSLTKPIETAIRDAKLTPNDFDEILLVGGSSRMPIFQSFLTRMFGRFPKICQDPDYIVGRGASIQAGLIAKDKALGEVLLTDVMPYSLGVGINNEFSNTMDAEDLIFSPILERNSIIPTSREEIYYPIHEQQTELLFQIYQGESRYVKNNIKLGDLRIKFAKSLQNKNHAVRFSFDVNGLLEARVKTIETGEEKTLIIQNNEKTLTDKEIKESLKKLEKLKIHPRDQKENSLLLARADRLYENSLSEIRGYLENLIRQFEQVLMTQDLRKIEKVRVVFEQKLEELEKDRQL